MPPHVAVDGGGNAVYAANGTLVELADHPLHRAFYADEGTPSLRRRGTCRPGGTLRGTAIRPPSSTFLRIATRTGERMIRFDAATRMGNRPAYEPVAEGQRLAVRTSRCGAHRVAERISFIGPTVALERLDPEDGGDLPIVYIVFGAILLISVPAILRITR